MYFFEIPHVQAAKSNNYKTRGKSNSAYKMGGKVKKAQQNSSLVEHIRTQRTEKEGEG